MTGQYGRGEVDDRIALLHRTSGDLDRSVRAYCDADDEFVDDYVCPNGHTFTTDGSDRHCPICDDDAHDHLERDLWDAHRDGPDPADYEADGGRLRYD